MTRSRYNKRESLNRIVRKLHGDPIVSDTKDVIPGEVLSEDEALSDLAELLEGSLPGETLALPAAVFASVDEANVGAATNVVLSPASHSWAHEYGGIYVSTGTVAIPYTASVWTKITGTFKNYMLDSGAEIISNWENDRVTVNEVGTYWAGWNLSVYTDGAARSLIDAKVFVSGSAQDQTMSRAEVLLTGSYSHFSGGGYVDVPAIGYPIDIRLMPSANLTIRVESGQLVVQKMVG
jgi:hypothetical protein